MKLKTLLSTILLFGAFAGQAMALQVTMQNTVSGTSGEYQAKPTDGLQWVLGNYVLGETKNADGWFGTFCLETNEYFSPGSTYNVTLATYASYGGVGGQTVPQRDYISDATAYLYSQFATGALIGFYNNSAATISLQDMIWWLEGEITTDQSSNMFAGMLKGKYGSLVDAQNSVYAGSDVMVMILGAPGQAQDQLVYVGVPDGGATLMLLGTALLALVGIRRRLRA